MGAKERLVEYAKRGVEIAEYLMAAIMVVMIFLGLVFFVSRLGFHLAEHGALNTTDIVDLLDIILVLFIVVELFRITVAYLTGTGQRILRAVVEAAFVAVGRRLVLYDYSKEGIFGALALTVLTLALVSAYYIIGKTRIGEEKKATDKETEG